MQEFTAEHRDEIRGVLSGFDRLVFTERYLDALAEVDDDTTLGRAHPAPGTASAGDATSPSPLSLVRSDHFTARSPSTRRYVSRSPSRT